MGFARIAAIIFALAIAGASAKADDPIENANPAPPQYLVFEVPGLPLYGAFYHSWYILRGPLLWHPTGMIDTRKFTWPRWEINQVPPAITYNGSNIATMVIADAKNDVIEHVPLTKGFFPQLYKAPPNRTPDHFHIELATSPERVRLISKEYEWPKVKQLFSCDVEVVEQDFDKATIESKADTLVGQGSDDDAKKAPPLEHNSKVKLCLESLQGVAKNATPEKQWYVDISWPKPQTRRSAMFISETERMLKTALAKNKHILITRRTTGRRFTASAGLTLVEKLQKPSMDVASLPKKDWHGDAPTREKDVKPVGEFTTVDGGRMIVSAFASDAIEKRSIDAPDEFDPPINIQFVKSPDPSASLRQTEFREERTGVTGFLRSFFISGSANYHTLKSGRGEELSSYNVPSFEAAWKSPYYNLEPFMTLEPGYIHQNSVYSLQEIHAGLRYRWLDHVSPFVGYFSYGLRGTNPTGSTRLGSIDGVSLGLLGTYRTEDLIMRGWVSGIATSPFSFDTYAELSKIFNKGESDRGLFFGVFAGYTVYRQDLLSLTRTTETFSETRFKVGLTVGLAGPDYLSPGKGTLGAGGATQSAGAGASTAGGASAAANGAAAGTNTAANASGNAGANSPPTSGFTNNAASADAKRNFRVSPLFVESGEYRFALDYKISDQWTLGPEIGYDQISSTSGTVTSATKGFLGGVRANWYPKGVFRDGWYVAPSLDYAMLNVSSSSGPITATGAYNSLLAQATTGYHFFLRDFNINLGVGYQYASQGKIKLAFTDGTSKDYNYNSEGWIYEITIGSTF